MNTTPQEQPRSGARRFVAPVVKAVVSIVLLWILFSRVDIPRLWAVARTASAPWLIGALGLYLLMVLTSAWRWGLLLRAQHLRFSFRMLIESFLVATFFNNFLPSNIGGDVIRIADTARVAGGKTLATTVVLMDRGIGLMGLVLMAAIGATAAQRAVGTTAGGVGAGMLWAGFGIAAIIATPALLMPHAFARMLQPLRIIHPEWIDARLERFTSVLARFRETPASIGGCFVGAIMVQTLLVAFYLAIAHSMRIPVSFAELAVIVPITFIVQMLPVSMNGFGVREATFGFYFGRLGLPLESALLVSFMGAALIMVFSLSGGMTYALRKSHIPAG